MQRKSKQKRIQITKALFISPNLVMLLETKVNDNLKSNMSVQIHS